MQSSQIYNQILKDCFWDYDFTSSDIDNMVKNNGKREMTFLFAKILENSTQMLNSMNIFDKNSLKTLIEAYRVPTFNHDYISRRLNILEYYFLDKPLTINELRWTA